jgi:hypothetical protein
MTLQTQHAGLTDEALLFFMQELENDSGASLRRTIFGESSGDNARARLTTSDLTALLVSTSARLNRKGRVFGLTKMERTHVRNGGSVVALISTRDFSSHWIFSARNTTSGPRQFFVAHEARDAQAVIEAELRRRLMSSAIARHRPVLEEVQTAPRRRSLTV